LALTGFSRLEDSVVVIGAGPAGLMAADTLAEGGAEVHIFDGMPSAGRKFLVAGKGGLNLTHNEPFNQFLSHYGDRSPILAPFLEKFGPSELRTWAAGLGVETFVGTSNRVFPVGMKSFPLLRNWLEHLRQAGVTFHFRHRWVGWQADRSLVFDTPNDRVFIRPRAIILALGGGSWPQTGSTGAWVSILRQCGIPVATLKPSNCGFDTSWTNHFRQRYEGTPVKSVILTFFGKDGRIFRRQGEFIITRTGIEGSLVYACSALLREEIEAGGAAVIHLDLAPGWSQERLVSRLSQPRGTRSFSTHLQKTIGLRGVKLGLLWEFFPREEYDDLQHMASSIKDLPISLLSPRPLEEAISSAGGLEFSALDERLMLRSLPGVFCAGEMLDWEAPTGGYLITACLSTGRAAGMGASQWLRDSGAPLLE
jgi:uncharacterized flavoprotein (TIGR03862 family)